MATFLPSLTLLHGDPHIGNTYVLPGDEVGFLDWQVVRRGNWSQDVGYFLVSALTVADRRESEPELIEAYRGTVSLPFEPGPHKRVAIKLIDDRGIESLKVVEVK